MIVSEAGEGPRTQRTKDSRTKDSETQPSERTKALTESDDPPITETDESRVIETIVCPFHCLYQDALHFHTQSRLAQSEGESARLSRAAILLYISSAEALVRQAAVELGRP